MYSLKVESMQWAVGGYCSFLGVILLVTPHQFGFLGPAYQSGELALAGTVLLLLGFSMYGVAMLALPRWAAVAVHLLLGAALLALAVALTCSGERISGLNFTLLGLGTLLAPWLTRTAERNVDFLPLVLGVGAILTGLLLYSPNHLDTPVYFLAARHRMGFALAFLSAGLWLAAVSLRPVDKAWLSPGRWGAYLWAAAVFFAFLLAAARTDQRWFAAAYYAGFSLPLPLYLRLSPRLERIDFASLSTRLAALFAIGAAVPLIVTFALISHHEEELVRRETLVREASLASAMAYGVADYIQLHQAALDTLALQPGLMSMMDEEKRRVLGSFDRSYPNVTSFTLYDRAGRSQTSRNEQALEGSIAGYPNFEQPQQAGQASMNVMISPGLRRPILGFSAPVLEDDGRYSGLVTFGLYTDHIARLLAEQSDADGTQVYLVDNSGRLIVHPGQPLMDEFTLLTDHPAVRAWIESGAPVGSLSYTGESGVRLAGYAQVPGYGLGLVVERLEEDALAGVYAARDLALGVLCAFLFLSVLGGIGVAGGLAAPLQGLARAASMLAKGDHTVPLPNSSIAEIRRLLAAFGNMRSQITARTAEREQAEKALLVANQELLGSLQDLAAIEDELRGQNEALSAAQQQLEVERRRYLDLFEFAPDGYLLTDAQGVIQETNRAAAAMLGISQELLKGKPISAYVSPVDIPAFRGLMSQIERLGTLKDLEIRLQPRQGPAFHVSLSVTAQMGENGGAVRKRPESLRWLVRDIRERKLAQAALQRAKAELEDRVAARTAELQQANRRMETVLAALPVAVWIAGPDGRMQQKNEMADAIWGGEAPLSETIEAYGEYRGWWAESGQELKGEDWSLARALKYGEISLGEVIDIQRFDGTKGTILNAAAPVYDEDGQVSGAVVVAQDITAQRQLEQRAAQAAAEAQQRANELAAVIAAMSDAVTVFDRQGVPVRANPSTIEMFGFDPTPKDREQAIDTLSIRYPDGRKLQVEEMPSSRALSGDTVRGERFMFTNARGRHYHILASASPVFVNDELSGAVSVWHDVTERVEMEQQLRESEERFRTSVENLTDGFAIFSAIRDESGRIVDFRYEYINEAGCLLNRRTREDHMGHTLLELLPGHQEMGILEEYERVVEIGEPFIREALVYEDVYGDGERVTRAFDTRGVKLGDGLVLIWRDVTGRVRMEEAVREYAAQLERSNRDLQDFAFIASHDLQEPLRKIQAFGERLKGRLGERLEHTEGDFLERMLSASRRMQAMIDDLLAYSRVTTKAMPFQRIDLGQVASEVLIDLEFRLERSGGQVILEELPVLEADPLQMRQLLQNLIGNALKFQRPGVKPVVRVSAKFTQTQIERESGLHPGELRGTWGNSGEQMGLVEIRVEDNGIGFEEDDLERIFQPFERLRGRSEYEGSGMGLAICRKIVERHGGSITARGTPEQGSVFVITLPIVHK